MSSGKIDGAFWNALYSLVCDSEIVIDRPKGSHHPRYPEQVYPGRLRLSENTTAMDGGGIDVWRGTDTAGKIDAIICIVDLHKKDSEIKILIGAKPRKRH